MAGLTGVGAVHNASEDTDLAARAQGRGRVAGVLDAGVDGFEEEAFLRVHPFGLTRRDLEEEGVEFVHIVEEPTPAAVARAEFPLFRIIELAPVPALRRNFADTVGAGFEALPEFAQISGARVTAAQADD